MTVILDYCDFSVFADGNNKYRDHEGNQLELVHAIPFEVHVELAEEDVLSYDADFDYSGESNITSDYLFFRKVL